MARAASPRQCGDEVLQCLRLSRHDTATPYRIVGGEWSPNNTMMSHLYRIIHASRHATFLKLQPPHEASRLPVQVLPMLYGSRAY